MTSLISPFILISVFVLSLFLSILNLSFWSLYRKDQTPLWLAAWLGVSAMFALCRFFQYATLNEATYIILPRILLTSSYVLAWVGYELANHFLKYHPPRWERSLIVAVVASLLLLLWSGNSLMTDQVVIRNISVGGPFHGVLAGPLYIPVSFLILGIGMIGPVRLIRRSVSRHRENYLMASGYLLVLLFSLIDFGATSLNLNWMRFSDYGYLPIAIFFTYIQIHQIGKLYEEMDAQVRERTAELTRVNEDMRTSEEKAQLSQRRLMGLVDSAMDAVVGIDRDHRILLFNPAAERMFGYTVQEMLGQTLDLILPERHQAMHSRQIDHFAITGVSARSMNGYVEVSGRKKNGMEFPLEASISQVEVGGEKLFTAILRDISERSLAEQVLQRQLMEMAVLNVVTTAGAKASEIDELLERVTDAIGKFLYPDNFGVLIADHNSKTWKPHYSYQGITNGGFHRLYAFSEGIAGSVISSGRLIRVGDTHEESAYLESTPGIQSEIAVPIVVDGSVFGCLNAESRKVDAFSERDERFISTVADSMATAIEKIQLLQTEKHRREDAEILYNTTYDLIIERDLSKLLQIIVERAVAMLGAPSGGLYLCDLEQRQVRCVVSYNNPRDYAGTVLNYGDGAAGTVAITGEPLIIEDYRVWDARATVYEDDQPFRSVLCVPMCWQDQVIGVIHILENSRPRSFTEEDLQIAKHFANQAAIAVENARLFNKEQQRRHEAEILRESILSLTYSMEPEKLFQVILETLKKLIPYDSASIELVEGSYLVIIAGSNLPDSIVGTRYLNSSEKWGNIQNLRDPVIISDVQNDDRFVKFDETRYIHGWMGIPLFAHDKLIGYLNLDSCTVGFFTEAHLSLAQIFGSQTAIALENMLLLQETIQHARESSAIAEIGRDISGTLNLDAVLEKICTYARNLLRADTSAVYLSQAPKRVLHATIVMGLDAEQVKEYPILFGTGILGNIAMQEVGEIVNDTSLDSRAVKIEGTSDTPNEHLMAVPVLSEDTLIGLIAVWRIGEGREFKSADLNFLDNLAQQVAVAIENARLFKTEQKRRQEANTLREAAQKITSTLNQEQAIQSILDQLAKVVDFKSASVQLLRDGDLELVGGRGWSDTSTALGTSFAIPGDNPNTMVVLERRAVILKNAPTGICNLQYSPA